MQNSTHSPIETHLWERNRGKEFSTRSTHKNTHFHTHTHTYTHTHKRTHTQRERERVCVCVRPREEEDLTHKLTTETALMETPHRYMTPNMSMYIDPTHKSTKKEAWMEPISSNRTTKMAPAEGTRVPKEERESERDHTRSVSNRHRGEMGLLCVVLGRLTSSNQGCVHQDTDDVRVLVEERVKDAIGENRKPKVLFGGITRVVHLFEGVDVLGEGSVDKHKAKHTQCHSIIKVSNSQQLPLHSNISHLGLGPAGNMVSTQARSNHRGRSGVAVQRLAKQKVPEVRSACEASTKAKNKKQSNTQPCPPNAKTSCVVQPLSGASHEFKEVREPVNRKNTRVIASSTQENGHASPSV